jgi:hypothetical protein
VSVAVLKSLAKDPLERYTSIQAFLTALDPLNKRELADQATLQEMLPVVAGMPDHEGEEVWEWEVTVPSEGDLGDSGPAIASSRGLIYNNRALATLPPTHQGINQGVSRRGRMVIISAIMLVLVLFFLLSRFFFFNNGSTAVVSPPSAGATRIATSAVFLTPATVTGTQATATGTQIALQVPTPTPPPLTPTASPDPIATGPAQVQVLLTPFFNNKGIGNVPGQANFDASGYSYPASQLPGGGPIILQGVTYQFPASAPGRADNLFAAGQHIPLPSGNYHQAVFLVSSSWGPVTASVSISYSDGSVTTTNVTVQDWYDGPSDGLNTQERYTPNGIENHAASIFILPVTLNTTRAVSALLLPDSVSGPHQNGQLHIFALTLLR